MHNQELIPVFTGTLAGVPIQLVDARTLHIFLEVGKDFSTWLKSRIKQYDFQENQDYIRIEKATNNALPKIGDGENQGFQPIDYHLTLDMSKELSMVERNAKGKEARRYFIECEKRLLGQVPEHVAKAYDELVENKTPIAKPLSVAEFEERFHFHKNGLENLKNAQIVMAGQDFLTLKSAQRGLL